MNRQFFNRNTVHNFTTFSKTSQCQSKSKNSHNTQKTKRVTSCINISSRLNPEKFIKRQVFNNKLYSQKPFNIAVEFRKQQQQESNKLHSFKQNQAVCSLLKRLNKQNSQQFGKAIEGVTHYFKAIYRQIDQKDSPNANCISKQLVLLKQAFQKVLKTLCKDIQQKEQNCVRLMFAQKAQINKAGLSQVKQSQNAVHLGAQTSRFSARYSNFAETNDILQDPGQKNRKLLTQFNNKSSSASTQALNDTSKYNFCQKIKQLDHKIRHLQFQNNKKILYIQTVQSQKLKKQQQIKSLHIKVSQMGAKLSKVKEIEQFYIYKIKKLKEQLQVAHIVKEQNLQEKMKYIMEGL